MIKKFLSLMIVLIMALSFASCGGPVKKPDESDTPDVPPEEQEKIYALTLAEDTLFLLEGDENIEVPIGSFTVNGSAADVSLLQYESSDTSVIAIQDNTLSAVGEGSAAVTVSYENASDVLSVTVYGVAENGDPFAENAVRLHGRVYENENGDLVVDNVNSGLEFAFYGTEFKASVKSDATAAQYVRCYLDGDEEGERISIKKQTEQTYVFAEGLKEGVHTVRIMKMTQQRTGGNSYSLVVTGVETGTNCRILEQGEENEEKLKIDFYGDSITAGEGNCSDTKEDAITVKNSDGTQTYASFTAQALGSEGSFVGYGGITVRVPYMLGSDITMYNIWRWYSTLNRTEYPVDPETDFVVINLGTNDSSAPNYTGEMFAADYLALLNEMKKFYPNAHFVLCYGMMGIVYKIDSAISSVVNDFDGEASYCRLPTNTSGAGSHPTIDGHKAAAKVLTRHIEGLMK